MKAAQKTRLKNIGKGAAGVAIIAIVSFLFYWCLQQIDFKYFLKELANARFVPLVAAMVAIYFILILNTWQWQLFLHDQSRTAFKSMFRVVKVMQMMANIVPWGNAFAVYHLGQLKSVTKTEALSVMTLDQVIEGVAKLAIFVLVAWIAPVPSWMKLGIQWAAVFVVLSFVIILVVAYRHRRFEERHQEDLQTLWQRFAHFAARWAHHLHAMRSARAVSETVIIALGMKVCEVAAVHFVQRSLGVELPYWSSFFVVAAYNLSTMVPIAPGNLGVFEATTFFVYKYMGVAPNTAMSLAVFNHVVYLVPMIVPGYLASLRGGIHLGQAVVRQFRSDGKD